MVRDPDLDQAACASSVDRCPAGSQGPSLRRAEILDIGLLCHISPAVGPAHHSRADIRHGIIGRPVNGSLKVERIRDDVKGDLRIILSDGDCPAVIIDTEKIGLLDFQLFLQSLFIGQFLFFESGHSPCLLYLFSTGLWSLISTDLRLRALCHPGTLRK